MPLEWIENGTVRKKFQPKSVRTRWQSDACPAAIQTVEWEVEYTDRDTGAVLDIAAGITVLPEASPERYENPDDVTWDTLRGWVMAQQGGEDFEHALDREHLERIEIDRKIKESTPYSGLAPHIDATPAARDDAVRAVYMKHKSRPSVTYGGHKYDSDYKSISSLSNALDAHARMGKTDGITWIDADNAKQSLKPTDMHNLYQLMVDQHQSRVMRMRNAKDMILAADNPVAVEHAKEAALDYLSNAE